MNNIIIDVLDLIEKNGFEAYIVGGFVRDKILGIESNDVDIITNAKPQEIYNIFKNNIKLKDNYGSLKLIINEYNIDITTYRKDFDYENNKPTRIEYINDVYEDLTRRDFTINTLLMNKTGKVLDLMNSIIDISTKTIKVVGDINIKFEEDTTRILRALRFMATLNFKLDNEIINYIKENKEKLNTISYYKRKEELDKVFVSNNFEIFLKFVKKYKLEKELGISYNKVVNTSSTIGIWSQLEYVEKYSFNREEKKQIDTIKMLIKKGNISRYDIYKYGSYICMEASKILRKNISKINKIYTSLPIKDIIEINISSSEICELLNIKPSKDLGIVYKELEEVIINNKIKNKKEDIIKYLKGLKK